MGTVANERQRIPFERQLLLCETQLWALHYQTDFFPPKSQNSEFFCEIP